MTEITKAVLPSDEIGNDSNAHRKDPDIWEKVEVKSPESGPHYTREGFTERAATKASKEQEAKAQEALNRILNASLRNPEQMGKKVVGPTHFY